MSEEAEALRREALVYQRDNLTSAAAGMLVVTTSPGTGLVWVDTVEGTLRRDNLQRFLGRVGRDEPDLEMHPGYQTCARLATDRGTPDDRDRCRTFVSHVYMAHEHLRPRVATSAADHVAGARQDIARGEAASREYLRERLPPPPTVQHAGGRARMDDLGFLHVD